MPSHPYQIATVGTRADGRIEVTIQGPGLRAAGQREIFASQERAASFVKALNFAYSEGLAEGIATSKLGSPRSQSGNSSS